ncbi:CD209 antigen-like [Oncorhynchus tshawytscha]|uniref:C-type lectin domain-containing protein n=3 Tax=Oncorhynchus TaxID=8016 RepID=A0AAZ3RPY5_ONCTS|nr:CD209 antigen-like [Oncorhynchus tshawytscha]
MADYVNKQVIELNKVTEENRKRLTRSVKTETHLSDGRLRLYRLAAVCLGVLCALQVTLNISLRLAFSGSNDERNQLETCYNTTSLPQDRDQSDTSSRVIDLCTERDQLQKERDQCRKNMNQLERMRGQLLRERDQLQSERDQLLKERDQLQSERDQLLKERDQLLKERDQLQSERDQLQSERDQLRSERDQLRSERDQSEKTDDKIQLQERNNALTKDRDMLRDRVSVLTNEKVALEKRLSVSELNICPKICNCCPEGWMLLGSSCYFLSTQQKTWEQSRLDCLNRGADLMIINSKEEQKFLCGLNKIVWIGLTDSVTGRTRKWMHGTPLTTASYWRSGGPYGGGVENCVVVRYWSSGYRKGWDYQCSNPQFWICEKGLL